MANRREFLIRSVSSVGLLTFSLKIPASEEIAGRALEIHDWISIEPGNRVVVRIPQPEIGQGATTALLQLVAEELELAAPLTDWAFYDPQTNIQRNNVYVHTAAITSWSITQLFTPMRTAGARIRELLLSVAARRLGVPTSELVLSNHVVHHHSTGRKLGFSELAPAAATSPLPTASSVALKPASQWNYIGKPIPRNDAHAKSTGVAEYGIDVSLPGMRYAAIKQSPTFGGRLVGFDADAIRHLRGVIEIVHVKAGPSGRSAPAPLPEIDWAMDDAVAVVANSWWEADKALSLLPIEWEEGSNASTSSAQLAQALEHAVDGSGAIIDNRGDVSAALSEGPITHRADYYHPFLEHAALEPMNCTAVFHGDSIEVWAPTQFGDEAVRVAAGAAKVELENAVVHLTMAGGGFGRRLHNDYVSQAVQIAKALPGTPIKPIWSREETTQRGYYPPPVAARFNGAVNHRGQISAWECDLATGRSSFQGYGMTRFAVPVLSSRIRYSVIDTPPGYGFMRGVGHAQMFWMNHGFLCELAERAGKDSLTFQLEQLDVSRIPLEHPSREDAVARVIRFRKVLDSLLDFAGLASQGKSGVGRGAAVHDMSYLPGWNKACIAAAVDVELSPDGTLRIPHVYAVADCGVTVNPAIVESQIEGGVLYGLSNALFGEITIRDGEVEQSNFHDYRVLRMSETPAVSVRILDSNEDPKGVGEGAVPVVMAALIEAVYNAGGPRIRALPLANLDLCWRAIPEVS